MEPCHYEPKRLGIFLSFEVDFSHLVGFYQQLIGYGIWIVRV